MKKILLACIGVFFALSASQGLAVAQNCGPAPLMIDVGPWMKWNGCVTRWKYCDYYSSPGCQSDVKNRVPLASDTCTLGFETLGCKSDGFTAP